MAILYTNPQGKQRTRHSYSAGQDFSCPRYYQHKRVEGWVSREERSAFQFGKAVESAIQFHHEKNFEPGSGVDEFKAIWFSLKDSPEITFTEKTGDWSDHYKMGVEMLTLYELVRPALPVNNAKFQQELNIPLFPGTDHEDIEFTAKLDMVAYPSNDHYMLPPMETPLSKADYGGSDNAALDFRKIIVDIKTSANMYFTDPRLASMDGQLRSYAWASGISTVSFLVLVKNKTKIEAGDRVNYLKGNFHFLSDIQRTVLDVSEKEAILLDQTSYEEYNKKKAEIKGKGAVAAKEELLAQYVFTHGVRVPLEHVTKQRIQFLPAIISEEAKEAAGDQAKKEALEISTCSSKGVFPQKPGVRYPHNVCTSCDMLGLCIGDKALVQERLVQISGEF